jgi:hypothetical protein
MQLNGELVHLKPQQPAEFRNLAQNIWTRMKPGEHLRQTVAMLLFEAMSNELAIEHPALQTLLWTLHDLGVEEIRVNVEGKQVDIAKVTDTESSRGDARALAVAAIESGRALIAALANVHQRAIYVNGEQVRAFPQPKEEVEKIIGQIRGNRLVNEDIVFTAGRALAAYMKAGKTMADPEYRAVVEVLAGLGVADIFVDLQAGQMGIRAFSEGNAACMALLQGASPKQVQEVRQRIQQTIAKLEATAREGDKPAPPPQRVAIPSIIGGQRTRRRR